MSEPAPFTLDFTQEVFEEFSKKYILILSDFLKGGGFNSELVSISDRSLGSSLLESSKDVQMFRTRRQAEDISPAKLAGILTFRLTRWNPIHLAGLLLQDKKALKINFAVAFAFCVKYVLNLDITSVPPSITQEFLYTLSRRHTNQETLGLAYDILHFSLKKDEEEIPA